MLIDRMMQFGSQGHFMTLKGTCVTLLKSMGVYETVKSHEWPSNEWDWYTYSGRFLRRVEKTSIDATLGGFLSVRRAHLHGALLNALPDTTELRMGTEIASLDDLGHSIEVVFSDNQTDSFDVVIGADGVHSDIRQRYFPELETRKFGGYYIVFLVKARHDLGSCTRTIWGPGRSVSLIPVADDQLGAMFYQDDQYPEPATTTSTPDDWKAYLSSIYQDFPTWLSDAIAAITSDDEIFADEITMVPATKLVKGRIVLLGDAGYCPTFFSGMGAAAALLGGYTLAQQIANNPVDTALKHYQSIMIALVRGYQRAAEGGPARTMPRGIRYALRNFATASIPHRLGEILSRRQYQAHVTLEQLAAVPTSPVA